MKGMHNYDTNATQYVSILRRPNVFDIGGMKDRGVHAHIIKCEVGEVAKHLRSTCVLLCALSSIIKCKIDANYEATLSHYFPRPS